MHLANSVSPTIPNQSSINHSYFTWFAFALTLVGVSSTDIYISSLPQLVKQFNVSPNIVNLTLSAYTFSMAISGLFCGVISNRFGRRTTLLTAICLYIGASLLIAHVPSIWLIISLRIVQAAATSTFVIVLRLILKDIMSASEQVHASGIMVMGVVISPAIAPSIGAYLAHFYGWESCFDLSAASALVLLVVAWKIIKETKTTPIAKFASLSYYLKEYFSLLTDKMCVSLVALISLTFACYFAFIGISSYLFINELHLSPISYSYLFIIIAAGFFCGNSYMIHLNKRRHSELSIISRGVSLSLLGLGLIISCAILKMQLLVTAVLIAGVLIMRAAASLILTPAQVRLLEHFGPRGAQAFGLATCIQFASASLALSAVTLFINFPLAAIIITTCLFFAPVLLIFQYLKRQLAAV